MSSSGACRHVGVGMAVTRHQRKAQRAADGHELLAVARGEAAPRDGHAARGRPSRVALRPSVALASRGGAGGAAAALRWR